MEFTTSYRLVLPADVRARYDFLETRNAAAVLHASNPQEFAEIVEVLAGFELLATDLTEPGGNKSRLAGRIDGAFRDRGWREGRHDLRIVSTVRIMPHPPGSGSPSVRETESLSQGYKVDNLKGRVALDVEWNAKDGNLDRDLGAYRAFYDGAIVDGAVIVTRSTTDLRKLAADLGTPDALKTSTTTNLDKLRDRLARGSAGGCPVLAVAVTARCLTRTPGGGGPWE